MAVVKLSLKHDPRSPRKFMCSKCVFCFTTITLPSVHCKFDPGRKLRFRVGGMHTSHFRVLFTLSCSCLFERLKHEMLNFLKLFVMSGFQIFRSARFVYAKKRSF
jgi:hypothetical protein